MPRHLQATKYMIALASHTDKPAKVPKPPRWVLRLLETRYFAGLMCTSLTMKTRVLFGSIIGGRPNCP